MASSPSTICEFVIFHRVRDYRCDKKATKEVATNEGPIVHLCGTHFNKAKNSGELKMYVGEGDWRGPQCKYLTCEKSEKAKLKRTLENAEWQRKNASADFQGELRSLGSIVLEYYGDLRNILDADHQIMEALFYAESAQEKLNQARDVENHIKAQLDEQ